jgi:hypothetical protein
VGSAWCELCRLSPIDDRQRPEVGGAVGAFSRIRAWSIHVANRIDGPGNVVEEGDAHQSGPEEGVECAIPRYCEQSTEERRAEHRRERECWEEPIDASGVGVRDEIGSEALAVARLPLDSQPQ